MNNDDYTYTYNYNTYTLSIIFNLQTDKEILQNLEEK